ncbi:MAG: phosphotransferase [Acidimicrobiales bacterium]
MAVEPVVADGAEEHVSGRAASGPAERRSRAALGPWLAGILSGSFGHEVSLEDMRLESSSPACERWAVTADLGEGQLRRLVLERETLSPAGRPWPGVLPNIGLRNKAAVMAAAATARVPVEPIVTAGPGGAVASRGAGAAYLVTERVAGERSARHVLSRPELAQARRALPAKLGEALGRLHSIAGTMVPGLTRVGPLERCREVIDDLEDTSPSLELAIRWLDLARPGPVDDERAAPVVSHGDFRLGNLVVSSSGAGPLAAVTGFHAAHLGDRLEDLGWLCAKPWRFGREPPVAGIGGYADLLDAYAAASGVEVSHGTGELLWWENVALLRHAVERFAVFSRSLMVPGPALDRPAERAGALRVASVAALRRQWSDAEQMLLHGLGS